MEINNIQRVAGVNPYRKENGGKLDSEPVKKGRKKDEVQISSEAKELLNAQGVQDNDARTRKIQELKRAVSAGTYQVDSGKVAEKLLPYLETPGNE